MSERVQATPEAIELMQRLAGEHGDLAIFQSGGCCDGTSPIVLEAGEMPPAPGDVQLGTIAGAPFYIDAEQYERWGSPLFMLDVADGEAQGFSLSARDRHLVTRTAPVKAHANADGAG